MLMTLLARFSEASSYAGLGALLAMLGFNLSASTLSLVVQLCAAGCGLAAIILKERGAAANPAPPNPNPKP